MKRFYYNNYKKYKQNTTTELNSKLLKAIFLDYKIYFSDKPQLQLTYKNRCITSGIARSFYNKLKINRNEIKTLLNTSQLNGFRKSSF